MLTYPSDHSLEKNHLTYCELQELKIDTQLKHVFNKQQERRAHETVALIKINTIFVSIFKFQFKTEAGFQSHCTSFFFVRDCGG